MQIDWTAEQPSGWSPQAHQGGCNVIGWRPNHCFMITLQREVQAIGQWGDQSRIIKNDYHVLPNKRQSLFVYLLLFECTHRWPLFWWYLWWISFLACSLFLYDHLWLERISHGYMNNMQPLLSMFFFSFERVILKLWTKLYLCRLHAGSLASMLLSASATSEEWLYIYCISPELGFCWNEYFLSMSSLHKINLFSTLSSFTTALINSFIVEESIWNNFKTF